MKTGLTSFCFGGLFALCPPFILMIDKHPTQMKIKYEIALLLLLVAQLTLGQSVMEVAEGYIGQRVGRGICWELVQRTLKTSGTIITEQDIVSDAEPGDIYINDGIYDSITPILDKNGDCYAYQPWGEKSVPHIAIVSSKIDSTTYEIIEQNYNGKRDKVKKNTVSTYIKPWQTGAPVKFYRPRKGRYNKETKTLIRKSTYSF